jgi:hypothetical protein
MFLMQNKPVLKAREVEIGLKVRRVSELSKPSGRPFLVKGEIVSMPYPRRTGSTQYYVKVRCSQTGTIYEVYVSRLTKDDD